MIFHNILIVKLIELFQKIHEHKKPSVRVKFWFDYANANRLALCLFVELATEHVLVRRPVFPVPEWNSNSEPCF